MVAHAQRHRLPTQTPTPSPTSTGPRLPRSGSTNSCLILPRSTGMVTENLTRMMNGSRSSAWSRRPLTWAVGRWTTSLVVAASRTRSPAGTLLLPGSFLFRFGSTTGLALNNDGDTVRLLAPDGAEVDSTTYRSAHADRSFSRSMDGGGSWTDAYPASPGQSNRPPTPTPTPTLTLTRPPTATPTATNTRTPTRHQRQPQRARPPQPRRPSRKASVLNEFLPEPHAIDWNGDGQARFDDEWIELYNLGAAPASLSGWAVADATQAYTLPLGAIIWPRGYLLLYRSQTHRTLGDDPRYGQPAAPGWERRR